MTEIKTEIGNLVRDTTNGALLNKDNDSLNAYKRIKQKNLELEEMKKRVNSIDNEISDIKSLLHTILEKFK